MPRLDPSREARLLAGVRHASEFFRGEADEQRALEKVGRLLRDDGIPHALVGALNEYVYKRVTVDVDLLLTREGLQAVKAKHLGRGYVEKFPGAKGSGTANPSRCPFRISPRWRSSASG